MKTLLTFASIILIGLSACKNHPENDKVQVSAISIQPPARFAPINQVTDEKEMAVDVPNEVADMSMEPATERMPAADMDKKIVKEGDISFESADVVKTRANILAALKKLGGYADDDSETSDPSEGRKEFILKIKIPAKNFEAFLGAVSTTAIKVDSRNIRVKDVSAQFIDIKTRLANKLALEARYLDLLKRGNKISDLLAIENKLAEIRGDVESTQNQLNYLSKQVAYSALDITFYTKQTKPMMAMVDFGERFQNALTNGWTTLQEIFFSVISIWPLLLCTGIILFIIKGLRNRRKVKAVKP